MKDMLLPALWAALVLLSGCAAVDKEPPPATLVNNFQPQVQEMEDRGVVVLNRRLNSNWSFELRALF